MRPLSKSEKNVVKKLCDDDQYFCDIFEEDFLQDFIIQITNDSEYDIHEIKIIIKRRETNSDKYFKEQIYEATRKIAETINLLNYLKSEAYIFSFKDTPGFYVNPFIGLKEIIKDYNVNPDNYKSYIFPDKKLYDIIFEFIDIKFASTEALNDYVDNDFRTPDQIRHRQNIFIAWIAIIISLVLGLIGIFYK